MVEAIPTAEGGTVGDSRTPHEASRARVVVLLEDEDREPLQKHPRRDVFAGEGPSSPRPERGSDPAVPIAPATAAASLPLPDSEREPSVWTWMAAIRANLRSTCSDFLIFLDFG